MEPIRKGYIVPAALVIVLLGLASFFMFAGKDVPAPAAADPGPTAATATPVLAEDPEDVGTATTTARSTDPVATSTASTTLGTDIEIVPQ